MIYLNIVIFGNLPSNWNVSKIINTSMGYIHYTIIMVLQQKTYLYNQLNYLKKSTFWISILKKNYKNIRLPYYDIHDLINYAFIQVTSKQM